MYTVFPCESSCCAFNFFLWRTVYAYSLPDISVFRCVCPVPQSSARPASVHREKCDPAFMSFFFLVVNIPWKLIEGKRGAPEGRFVARTRVSALKRFRYNQFHGYTHEKRFVHKRSAPPVKTFRMCIPDEVRGGAWRGKQHAPDITLVVFTYISLLRDDTPQSIRCSACHFELPVFHAGTQSRAALGC